MTELLLLLNVFFAIFCLKWAKDDFEKENDFMGWFWIVCSAWNTATVMNVIFK